MKFDKFFTYFREYTDCYVIIGGNAAAFWLEQDQQDFRATQDYDMVVIFESTTDDFAKHFRAFILENHYFVCETGTDTNKQKVYYRYKLNPQTGNDDVPKQIELFSRIPLKYQLDLPTETTPLHYEEGPSLSAIVLDDNYYQLLKNCQELVGDVSVLSIPGLIFFKAKAHLDIVQRLSEGKKISHRADKSKHFKDVCRLCDLLSREESFKIASVPVACQNDLRSFITIVESETDKDFKQRFRADLGFDLGRGDVVAALNTLLSK
ncbi:hypothetical protein [Levilactobacillus mulengensis]|uniref:hypothetical protein n=1 Tax=Levilactobacillus mulengensis TaxID=2486025 RepID=UPI000F7B4B14|nr:hypothetical protein [Levilactobacillus mulengensis]